MTGYTLYIAAGTKNRAEICTSHIPRDIADLFYIDTFPRIVRAGYDTDFSWEKSKPNDYPKWGLQSR